MRWIIVLVLVAGCTQPLPAPEAPVTDEGVIMGECTLAFPDGAPVDCTAFGLVPAESQGRPSLLDGWKCTNTYNEDGVLVESYSTADGRIGFYWEWQRWKEDGLAFQRLGWFEGEGEGDVRHVEYQPKGFVSLPPQDPAGPVEIHHSFRQLRVHAHIDGQWVQDPDNVTFIITNYGGDLWWAARFDWPGGPYFVDTMGEDREEGQLTAWAGSGWRGHVAGTEVIIDSQGGGIKYTSVDFAQRRAAAGGCGFP